MLQIKFAHYRYPTTVAHYFRIKNKRKWQDKSKSHRSIKRSSKELFIKASRCV